MTRKQILIGSIVFLVSLGTLFYFLPALGLCPYGRGGFFRGGYGMYGNIFHMGGPFMFFLLFLILAVVLLFLLYKKDSFVGNNTNNAITILDERFARGEINEEEYLSRKSTLSSQHS